ncbi:snake venom vascular endothelial growth factor toxin ICPP-like [Carassius auratus]|uniref:Snake venom vascular endothelial growth factor toxin ICPP-like n=1 Tax=Carassius auratus TaxID=7957 RepID=A0A6P6M414_CARAU|nr:snake venom vascular endothelial growth factor toxin ICPP-like [Carassius auratus]XP_052393602.1 snake venom vascular endothelial growth factor toxin-like [Carassius gibelio]
MISSLTFVSRGRSSSIMLLFLCVLYLVLYHQASGMNVQHRQKRNIGQKSVPAWMLYARSLCEPRETLVKVEDEFPEVMNMRIFPSCVPLKRCGGCCSDEATLCVNVSSYTTVMQFMQLNVQGETIDLQFVEHSQCECRFRDQL